MKTPNDVRGRKINCINYAMCPICYGCRNYNSLDEECSNCKKNSKMNLCNTTLHKPELVARFITKSEIIIKEQTELKSF